MSAFVDHYEAGSHIGRLKTFFGRDQVLGCDPTASPAELKRVRVVVGSETVR